MPRENIYIERRKKKNLNDELSREKLREPIKHAALSKVYFEKELHGCLGPDETIEFRPGLNLLVGDQGCGKSTLLQQLMSGGSFNHDITVDPGTDFRFFDSEKHNPRTKQSLEYSEDIGEDLISHFQSHGQTLLPRVKAVSKMKGYIIFLDEPEAALSIRSQIIVANCIKKASENNQVFVATHNSYIIKMADEVLDLERRIWTSSEEFIKFQEEGKPLKRKKK